MNKFMILNCLVVLLATNINARPDLSLGYHYHQGHSSGGGAFLNAPSVNPISTSYVPTASGNSYFNSAPAVGQVGNSGFIPSTQTVTLNGGGGGGSVGGGFLAGGIGGIGGAGGVNYDSGSSSYNTQYDSNAQQQQQQQVNYDEQQAFTSHLHNHQAPLVTKHFYVHSAPVDQDEQQITRYINVGRPQKNYRVVFIDAPSSSSSKAKIIANVAPVEDKTAIYVLSKKSNALDVSAEVVTPAPVNNKPEVFFIKYQTPQEAIHAQHTIQAQYDALGGTSDVSDEGVVPVSSVIGSLDGAAAGVGADSSNFGGSSSSGGISGGQFIGGGSGSSGGISSGQFIGGASSGGSSSSGGGVVGVNYISSGGSSSSIGGISHGGYVTGHE